MGEILNGRLHTHPRPAPKHAIACSGLGGNLWNPFQHGSGGPGGEPLGRGEQILSPATARTDRVIKMPLYARQGVQHLWLVDPDLKTLEVYQLKESHWTLLDRIKDDDPVRQPPFDTIEFSLGSLWG